MDVAEFVRRYHMRSPNIMWLLGAGASAASGIATAGDMIWEFKRVLYCTRERIPLDACRDLAATGVRDRLQRHFDSQGTFPPVDSPEEYAVYFEAAYPQESDRRRYIESTIAGARPCYGHLALATLMRLEKARVVWTTNFDRMVEDACAQVFGNSSALVTATLDSPDLALQALNEGRWPLLTKLHGDFQSNRLKNTSSELMQQNEKLRKALREGCRRYGLAVAGYSGRDGSVMATLEETIDGADAFPGGLFWFHKAGCPCLARVEDLIKGASARGVDAHLVEVETFDELLGDLLLLVPEIPEEIQAVLTSRMNRASAAPVPKPGSGWPVVRLNALPLLSFPSVCRRVACGVGGYKEMREAVTEHGADVIVGRRRQGVIGFGRDQEMRKAFSAYGITEFDLHSIDPIRLRYESAEHGILYDALQRALTAALPLIPHRRRTCWLLAVDDRHKASALAPLRQCLAAVCGTVPGTAVQWAEAIRIRLEYRLDTLLLVFEPTVWTALTDEVNGPEVDAAKEFVRERLASRYNRAWNDVVDAWAGILTSGQSKMELRAFSLADGVDAVFVLSKTTAFARRLTSHDQYSRSPARV